VRDKERTMSGGSYDYAYRHIEDLANRIAATTPLRRAFVRHLLLVSRAARDVEWVDSCDYGAGGEEAAIRLCLQSDAELAEVIIAAKRAKADLEAALNTAEANK
jgi:hypothetical protein